MDNQKNKIEILRKNNFDNQVVIVDGLPGCGKSMFSKIIASMERVELVTYLFELEFICRLNNFNKIENDAAVTMVRLLADHKLYQIMMGREMNFRYSDVSSVFKDSNPFKYFKRIFQEGDQAVPNKIKKEKPILNIMAHDILSVSEPLFLGLKDRLSLIEIVRHPLYMIKQNFINMENVVNDARDIQITIRHNEDQLPYFAHNWEKLYISSNSIEKAIYSLQKFSQQTCLSKQKLIKNYKNQILTIPFEHFVLNPKPYLKKIENLLNSKITAKTKKVLINVQ